MPLPILLAAACATGTVSVPDETTPPTGTDPGPEPGGFEIRAVVADAFTGEAAPPGRCVDLIDPTPTLLGEDPAVLGSDETAGGGDVAFGGVSSDSTVGLLLVVGACGDVAVPTGTRVPRGAYADLGDGDVLSEVPAAALDDAMLDALQASLEAAGSERDLADGFLLGFVVDGDGEAIEGATVSCTGCPSVWYLDDDGADGLFSAGGLRNTATSAAGGGAFVVPGAPVGTYLADDGGAHTFAPRFDGAWVGTATVSVFAAE